MTGVSLVLRRFPDPDQVAHLPHLASGPRCNRRSSRHPRASLARLRPHVALQILLVKLSQHPKHVVECGRHWRKVLFCPQFMFHPIATPKNLCKAGAHCSIPSVLGGGALFHHHIYREASPYRTRQRESCRVINWRSAMVSKFISARF